MAGRKVIRFHPGIIKGLAVCALIFLYQMPSCTTEARRTESRPDVLQIASALCNQNRGGIKKNLLKAHT